MSRARKPVLSLLFLSCTTATLLVSCGGSGDGGSGPAQTVSTITVTAANSDVMASLGDTKSFSAVAKDAAGTTLTSPSIAWTSSAPNVATVTGSGTTATVVSVGNGTATITASSGSAQGSASVTVTQRATAVALSGLPAFLTPGGSAQLTAEARDAKGRAVGGITGYTFASSDQSIAVVSATGLLTAISPGNAQISGNATVSGAPITGSSPLAVAFATSNPNNGAVNATDANQFVPASITIAPGGTITWSFATVLHNAVFAGGAGAPANIPNVQSTQVSRQFPTAGTFVYNCTLHSGMQGTVIVQGSGSAPGFTAILNGANERPNPATTTGAGAASFVVTGTTVAYTVTFSRLTGPPSMAHIHGPGNATQAVGVLVDFPTTGQTLTNGVLTGTFNAGSIRNTAISLDSLLVLMRNGNAYVNVHTTQFPGGEIRGQVSVPQ